MTAIPDITERELLRMRFQSKDPFAVFIYTPWCGTCKWGEKMLSVVKSMEPSVPLYKSNINFLPALAQEWKIVSIPCLIFVEERRVREKLYRMNSVEYLLEEVRNRLLKL